MTDRRHRQKEQRAAKRKAEKRREARKELGRRLITAVLFGAAVVAVFILSGLGGGEEDLPSAYEGYRELPTACGADQPEPEQVIGFESPQTQPDLAGAETVTATIATSCGEIVIQLDKGFPQTLNSFVFLAREGFYDGQVFHRIAADFVVQGGDPSADGTGGPGYVIPDEFPDDDFVYEEGVVAMANRGSRSTGSQFFIVIGDGARFLNNQFSVLGRVVSGSDTLEKIAQVPTRTSPGTVEESLPLEAVYIESVTIEVTGS
jgi:cyclophilin family peptidyl-prolyl cis-trans isomerase